MPNHFDPNAFVTVYDLAGKGHSLSRINATDCVAHLGWSLSNFTPETEEPVAPVAPTETSVPPAPPAPDEDADEHEGESEPKAVHKPGTPAIWEDLVALGKDNLRKAGMAIGCEIDGRANDKRLVVTIDSLVDARLTASGDVEGAESPMTEDAPDVFAAKSAAIAARRLRAYDLEAKRLGVEDGLAGYGESAFAFLHHLAITAA